VRERKRLSKVERWRWLLRRLFTPEQHGRVDVLDAKLVDDFEAATGAPIEVKMYGANGCRTLEDDLRNMHGAGLLDRCRVGISGMPSGFPKWVFSYREGPKARVFMEGHWDA
jgi:hypothetical protein